MDGIALAVFDLNWAARMASQGLTLSQMVFLDLAEDNINHFLRQKRDAAYERSKRRL